MVEVVLDRAGDRDSAGEGSSSFGRSSPLQPAGERGESTGQSLGQELDDEIPF